MLVRCLLNHLITTFDQDLGLEYMRGKEVEGWGSRHLNYLDDVFILIFGEHFHDGDFILHHRHVISFHNKECSYL